MKKILSFLLSVALLVSCFSVSLSSYAAAKVPAYKVGDSFDYTLDSKDESYFIYEDGEYWGFEENRVFGTFKPKKDGYYEFSATVDGTGDDFDMYIREKNGKEIEAFGFDSSYTDILIIPYLESGKTYIIGFWLNRLNYDFSGTISIKNHTHKLYSETYAAYMEYNLKKHTWEWKDGCIEQHCSRCNQLVSKKKFAAPKSTTASNPAYDGKAKGPSNVKVYDNKGKLINSKNYKIEYDVTNKSVGVYVYGVVFDNDLYQGDMIGSYRIVPKGTSITSLSARKKGFFVKWNKKTTQTTGYQIQYATDSKFSKDVKTVTVSKTGTTSKTLSNLKAKKKYYVRVRTYKTFNGTKIYSSWSNVKTVTTKK